LRYERGGDFFSETGTSLELGDVVEAGVKVFTVIDAEGTKGEILPAEFKIFSGSLVPR
jgi:hypothetical protein